MRYALLSGLALLVFGSLATTAGYAWHLRSPAHRASCSASLSESLSLPSEIGQIVPRSRRSREFCDVTVFLPQRRGKALECRSAIVTHTPTPAAPQAYEIELRDGVCEISDRTWLREDYRAVLESGLRPGFDPSGPKRVRFSGMDLHFERGGFTARLRDASGVVDFDQPDEGHATIVCNDFNGRRVDTPVILRAVFAPYGRGARVEVLTLDVPSMPLDILGLKPFTGLDLRSGRFSGRLEYAERDDVRRLEVSGRLFDLDLAEFGGLFGGPTWRGVCPELELDELVAINGELREVRLHGALNDVYVGDLLAPWGWSGVGGQFDIRLRDVDLTPEQIRRVVLSGRCENISLNELSRALGWGEMSGVASVVIDDLTIEHDRLTSLSGVARVHPSATGRDWIEGRLLRELVVRTLGLRLPPILPGRVDYAQLGVRIDVRDEQMYVFGTHGERDQTILTAVLAGAEVPLVREPGAAIDLRPMLDDARRQGRAYVAERVQALRAQPLWPSFLNSLRINSSRPAASPSTRPTTPAANHR